MSYDLSPLAREMEDRERARERLRDAAPDLYVLATHPVLEQPTTPTGGEVMSDQDRMINTPYGKKRASYLCYAMDVENASKAANLIAAAHDWVLAAAPDMLELAREIAAQDEFTGATPDNPALWQAYALLNAWRNQARAAIAKTEGRT